jgi:hypothetical protein
VARAARDEARADRVRWSGGRGRDSVALPRCRHRHPVSGDSFALTFQVLGQANERPRPHLGPLWRLSQSVPSRTSRRRQARGPRMDAIDP